MRSSRSDQALALRSGEQQLRLPPSRGHAQATLAFRELPRGGFLRHPCDDRGDARRGSSALIDVRSRSLTGLAIRGFCRVANAEALAVEPPAPRLGLALRTLVRVLEGMQKEALVVSSATGDTWRLASDEGPYLAGTDLAPPPLGLFVSGMVAVYANELLALAAARRVRLRRLRLVQDTFYSMQGSALRGTMIGSALPPRLEVEADGDLGDDDLQALAVEAVTRSALAGLIGGVHDSLFTLVHNGERAGTGRVAELPGDAVDDPQGGFDRIKPQPVSEELLRKVQNAGEVEGEGGANSSLQPEQSRTLNARAVCTIRDDGVKEIDQFLFKPVGSQFRLLSDESGRAPDAFSYLAAGIGFCFMTQLGRYASITKKPLDDYRIVQDTHFSTRGAPADPVETHVFLDSPEDTDTVRQILDMSEQTCFLHALCRTDLEPLICFVRPR
jgi:OsmC-like protein